MRGSDRQFLAAQHMEMQVLHGLAGILADIGDHAVAVVQTDLFGQLGDHGKDMAQQAPPSSVRQRHSGCAFGTTRKCTLACGLIS